MIKMRNRYQLYLPLFLSLLMFAACTHNQPASVAEEKEDYIEKEARAEDRFRNITKPQKTEPEIPEFVPVKEESSPLTTKKVSIAARNTPLRDVLFTIAQAAHLNLAMQRGVEPDMPVTMNFNDLSVANALDLIFDSVDYFYTVKDNVLIVKAMDTKIFEFGQPNVIQDFKLAVGGDILSGTSSSGGEKTALSGDLSITSKADEKAFLFWDGMEASLATILSIDAESQDENQASFALNRMAGTIMVTAAKKELQRVSDFIANVSKVLNRQVYIEARIIEVQLSEGLRYGIDWTDVIRDIDAGDLISGDVIHGTDFFSNVVSDDGPNYSIFNIQGDNDFNFLIRALQDHGDVKTLSNPRVSIMNGQTSMLSVGRNTSFIASVESTITTAEGSTPIITFSVETNSILSGVLFGLVPYINSDGEITLTITPIITNLVNLETKEIGANDSTIPAVELKLPTVDLREMTTTVKVQDGQMIVIGGLIDNKEVVRENKVPLLSNIPFLGHLFRSVERTEEKTELVIILMPRILG